VSRVVSRVWLISVCMCAGVVSVVGLISDITSAKVSATTDKCACVVRPSSSGVNSYCGGESNPPSDGEGDGLVQTWEHNECHPIPLILFPAEGGAS